MPPETEIALHHELVDAELIQTAHGPSGPDRQCNANVRFPQPGEDLHALDLVPGGHFGRQDDCVTEVIMPIGRDLLRPWRFTCRGPESRFSPQV